MRKLLSIAAVAFICLTGCVQTTETTSDTGQKPAARPWYDSLIMGYINDNDELLVLAAQDNSMDIEWRFAGMVKTDSTEYMSFRIGHSAENRFVTDDWVYIDSAQKKLYGYDARRDSIMLWHNKQ